MTRKVTLIKYYPQTHVAEISHSDGSKTTYTATIPSQVRLEFIPFRCHTSFAEIAGKVTIFIRKETIKINW
jgi:hypothetical protein